MVFHIEINYLNKEKEKRIVTQTDNVTALTYVLNNLNLEEKNNVIGLKITYIKDYCLLKC